MSAALDHKKLGRDRAPNAANDAHKEHDISTPEDFQNVVNAVYEGKFSLNKKEQLLFRAQEFRWTLAIQLALLSKKLDKKLLKPFIDNNSIARLLTANNALGDLTFKPQDLIFMSKETIEQEFWIEFLKSLADNPPIAKLMIIRSVYGAPKNLDREVNRIHDKARKILLEL